MERWRGKSIQFLASWRPRQAPAKVCIISGRPGPGRPLRDPLLGKPLSLPSHSVKGFCKPRAHSNKSPRAKLPRAFPAPMLEARVCTIFRLVPSILTSFPRRRPGCIQFIHSALTCVNVFQGCGWEITRHGLHNPDSSDCTDSITRISWRVQLRACYRPSDNDLDKIGRFRAE